MNEWKKLLDAVMISFPGVMTGNFMQQL